MLSDSEKNKLKELGFDLVGVDETIQSFAGEAHQEPVPKRRGDNVGTPNESRRHVEGVYRQGSLEGWTRHDLPSTYDATSSHV